MGDIRIEQEAASAESSRMEDPASSEKRSPVASKSDNILPVDHPVEREDPSATNGGDRILRTGAEAKDNIESIDSSRKARIYKIIRPLSHGIEPPIHVANTSLSWAIELNLEDFGCRSVSKG